MIKILGQHLRAEAKKPIKSRKTGAKLYANTVSKQLVALRSSPRDNHPQGFFSRDAKANLSNISPQTRHTPYAPPAGFCFKTSITPAPQNEQNQ